MRRLLIETTTNVGHRLERGGGRTSEQSVQREYKAAVALANKFGDKGFAGRFTKEGLEISIPLTHVEQFGFDIDSLGQEAQGRIKEFATIVQKNGAGRGISIVGHTDQIGDKQYNDDLGGRRATAAQLVLMTLGLRNPISTSSRGESDLIVTGSDADTDSNIDRVAANRRVVITVAANIPGDLLGKSWDGKSRPNFSAGAAREGHGGNAASEAMEQANSKHFGRSGDQGNGVSNILPGVRHVATLQGRPLLEQKLENGNYQYSFIDGNKCKKVVFWDSKEPLIGNQFKTGSVRKSLDEKMGTKTANMPSEGGNLNSREGSTDGVRHSAAVTVRGGGRFLGTANIPDGEKIIGRQANNVRELPRGVNKIPGEIKVGDYRGGDIVVRFNQKGNWEYSWRDDKSKAQQIFFVSGRCLTRPEIDMQLKKSGDGAPFRKNLNAVVDELTGLQNRLRNGLSV